MTDKDKKKPEKIDMSEILGAKKNGSADPDEIELLDPSTGAPMDGADAEQSEHDDRPNDATSSAQLDAANAEREKYYDLWVRSRADFENYRKRIEREREEEQVRAGATLVRDLLPVVDNLERAL